MRREPSAAMTTVLKERGGVSVPRSVSRLRVRSTRRSPSGTPAVRRRRLPRDDLAAIPTSGCRTPTNSAYTTFGRQAARTPTSADH
jgi:hypothetical protein